MASTILETLRIFAIMGASTGLGVLLGGIETFVGGASLAGIVGGGIAGFLCTGFAAPLLWRRPLLTALAVTALASVAVTAAASLTLGFGWLLGLATYAAGSLVAWARLPIVFPDPPPGCCPWCHYSLHGLRTPRCPECGKDVFNEPAMRAP